MKKIIFTAALFLLSVTQTAARARAAVERHRAGVGAGVTADHRDRPGGRSRDRADEHNGGPEHPPHYASPRAMSAGVVFTGVHFGCARLRPSQK